jgi:protein TonB
MSSYSGTADRPDRAKAIAAVIAVHVALAAIILTGLNVRMVNQAVERLVTFDIPVPPPPPPKPPPPQSKTHQAKREAGAPAKKAEATPVVAPRPRLPVQSPIPAAPVAGTGSATSSGAASSGTGTGAGGNGNGPGGGGGGDYSRFTPAQRISKIPDREYRRLLDSGLQAGRVGVTIRVNTDGSVANCRVAQSSGNGYADSLMCQLTLRYIRFRPARDPSGRPVAQDVTFYPNWYRP